LPESFKLNEQN